MQQKDKARPLVYRLLRMIGAWALAGLFGASVAAALPLDGIDHFAVNVHDLKASESWYEKVFGFRVLHEWQGVSMVGVGNIKIGLFEKPKATPVANPDTTLEIAHVAFLVDGDKFADVLAAIRAQGVPIVTGPEDIGIAFSFFIKDPDGNLLEFITYHGQGAILPK
jgi:catechol 2,3-dioxygenase-like lactoylglutathione lyase family enzyme